MSLLTLPEKPNQLFERGDKIYMTAPVQVFTPTDQQKEEFAFAQQVKKTAPNDNIVWLRGQYVEADNPNLNGAQWTADELAIKSLTPMLMPVTVMHDPRTAVGTIADVALLTPAKDDVPRARIETVLALWGHRFPEAVQEAVANASAGTLMQSMECFSPWYACSECGATFHKLPGGAEQANWCAHLQASKPSGGYLAEAAAQTSNASRILGDVTFTGTGLIYGSRGVKGAYTEAHLEMFQDELASYHESAHTATATSPASATGGSSTMGLVQIDENELKILRDERDAAKAEASTLKSEKAAAEKAAEDAEAAKAAAEEEKASAVKERDELKEQTEAVALKEERWGKLGAGFVAKLGDFTRGRLEEQAKSLSDDEWEARLKELEETASVKRDAAASSKSTKKDDDSTDEEKEKGNGGPTFESEEVAAFVNGGGPAAPTNGSEQVVGAQRSAVISTLAGSFKKSK